MSEPSYQNPTHRRRRYFLPDSSQPRLSVGIELIFLILLIVSGATLYVVANRDLTTTYLQAHLNIKNLQEILLPVLVAVNLGGLVLGAVLSIFFTHRIAGPVYRVCRILREVGKGNLVHTVKFRKNDELKELDNATTEMLEGLNQRLLRLKAITVTLRAQTDAAIAAGVPSVRELEHGQDAVVALEQELAGFELMKEKTTEPPEEASDRTR